MDPPITGTVPTSVADIEAKLDHATHGLAALQALLDAILLDTGATLEVKLDNIKTVVDAILIDTTTTLEGKLDAIKIVVDALEVKLDGVSGLTAIKVVVDAILVDTSTTLENKIDAIGVIALAIQAVTNNLPDAGALTALLTDIASILTDTGTTIPGLLATIAGYIDTEIADIKTQTDKIGNATIGLANLKALIDTLTTYVDTEVAAILAAVDTEVASILAYVDCLPAALGNLVTKNLADILSDSIAFAGADIAAIKAYVDLIDDVTNGLAAIKAEVEGLAGAAMRGTDGAALAASWTAGLATILANFTAARIGYLDNINQVGLLQVTAARAALLDQITALRMGELDAGNIPTDLANIIAYVDLIDDVTNGLAAIKAEVEGLAGAAMRGTDNAALAATALSTATWTATLAAELEATAKGKLQIKATTVDLAQAGGTVVDLFIATTQDVVVEKLVIRMSGGTLVGSNLTSILIQTDDATPIVLIDIVAGAVANLTNEAQLAWTGAALLDAGTGAKIQLTINGGVAGPARVCDVVAEYRAVVSGGLLV